MSLESAPSFDFSFTHLIGIRTTSSEIFGMHSKATKSSEDNYDDNWSVSYLYEEAVRLT
jgi:hypothetical protein